MASILEHRHPLQDPSQPEHPTKNRPDKSQPADVARGQKYVESLGLANARDIIKMLRWNEKYGIRFMRLSSEMFPFASHVEYGYKLEPFAAETLAEVGTVAAELGHRLTTHPSQVSYLLVIDSVCIPSMFPHAVALNADSYISLRNWDRHDLKLYDRRFVISSITTRCLRYCGYPNNKIGMLL